MQRSVLRDSDAIMALKTAKESHKDVIKCTRT